MNADQILELMKPNFFKKHSLDKELVVSLTSYPSRFNILPITIQSLLNQTVKPDRIILWLYEKDYFFSRINPKFGEVWCSNSADKRRLEELQKNYPNDRKFPKFLHHYVLRRYSLQADFD